MYTACDKLVNIHRKNLYKSIIYQNASQYQPRKRKLAFCYILRNISIFTERRSKCYHIFTKQIRGSTAQVKRKRIGGKLCGKR